MTIEIREATLDEIKHLRTKILRPNFPPGELALYDADALPETLHVGAFNGLQNLGAATFLVDTYPGTGEVAIRLRGMVVQKDLQGEGIGTRLLEHAYTLFFGRFGLRFLWCNARVSALGFYENQKFETFGDVFDIPGIGPHFVMWREMT